jgi:Ca-activated chloride channel family protein
MIADSARMRMVVMLTDGYIGNEAAIIGDVGTRGNDRIRFWCIGIGSSPNRFLVDGVAAAGGGGVVRAQRRHHQAGRRVDVAHPERPA